MLELSRMPIRQYVTHANDRTRYKPFIKRLRMHTMQYQPSLKRNKVRSFKFYQP
jgi:hypothetical protein